VLLPAAPGRRAEKSVGTCCCGVAAGLYMLYG
jgi:hypothetical protein